MRSIPIPKHFTEVLTEINSCSSVMLNGETWLYLPVWMKENNGFLELYHYDELSELFKENIKSIREFQPQKKYPL